MIKNIIRYIAVLISVFTLQVNAEVVVVANAGSDMPQLSKNELVDLYMGRFRSLPNNQAVTLFDHDDGSVLREEFYRQLIDKSEAEVNAFWARLLFTGRAKPPEQLIDTASVIDAVASDSQAIGYIEAEELVDSVKVIFHFN